MTDLNPYSAPASVARQTRQPGGDIELKKFNQQIVALGAFWILIGILALGGCLLALLGFDTIPMIASTIYCIVAGVFGLMWILIGVFACVKNITSVRVGLALTYLSLLGQVVFVNICGMVILAVVIAQAHRVISWSKDLVKYSE